MNWPKVRLDSIAKIVQGGRLGLSGKQFVERGFPAYGAGGMNGYLKTCEFNTPGIVLGTIGTVGRCYLPEGCWTSLANTQLIFPETTEVDIRFLWYQLNDPDSWYVSGSAQQFIKPSTVKAREVLLPTLLEQRRTVSILDQSDWIRRKRREALALTDELQRATFLEMFGDPIANPRGWQAKPIGELIDVKSGDFLPAKNMEASGSFAVYGGNGINGRHSEYMFDDPMIVIGRVGAYCGVVHLTEPRCWVTDNALFVSRRSSSLHLRYLEYALRLLNLNRLASQVAQPLISASRIYPVMLMVPPQEQQHQFSLFLERAEALFREHETAAREAELLFELLQLRAFRGEL